MSEYSVKGCECVSNIKVYGLDESIKRAKYPMSTDIQNLTSELTNGIKSLAQCPNGAAHDQWITGVIVQFDLSFTNKGWIEAERYHFFEFVSSQSTIHKITKFDLDVAYNKYVDKRIVEIMKEKIHEYNEFCDSIAVILKECDQKKQKELREKQKEMYLGILYSNPAGFILTAGMTTNYRQLKTIYSQRAAHLLPEWRQFCKWIETLPHSELITRKRGAYEK